MDENEIIEYLKDNVKKGVMFAFMPEPVRRWCHDHKGEPVFCFYSLNSWSEEGMMSFHNDVSYCLTKNYVPRRDFDGFWEEFEIDDLGYFFYNGHKYYYREDGKFETEHSDKYKGFGGWLWNDRMWSVSLHVLQEGDIPSTFSAMGQPCNPAIPIRIRFWRYRK